jgi:L-fuculose-phosphate aldolase
MSHKANIKLTYKKFRQTGKALLRVNGNNIHSGNLSVRDPDDPDRFYITASGSQIGALVLRDIVSLRFSGVSRGDERASTESNIHRKVLNIPGVNACMHCHHIISALITFDTRERQIFLHFMNTDSQGREEFVFQPVDIHGCSILGGVVVGSYKQPIGSIEMEERIPKYLSDSPVTLVKGHGPFARGASLEECLRCVSVLENSATIADSLRRRGIDFRWIQKKMMEQGAGSVFPGYATPVNDQASGKGKIDDVSTISDFAYWLSYIHNFRIGAYATGSMSRKVTSEEMIFCPMSSVPENMDFPLYRVSTKMKEGDNFEIALHKLIYNQTDYTACIMATNPLACADGMAILAEKFGIESLLGESDNIPYFQEDHPVITPIDAEGIHLNPRLGLVDVTQLNNLTPENPILDMLRWHKGCCVVAGFGVIAAGETTIEQAACNIASAERIGNFRTEVFINEKLLNGPPMKSFEPKTL